MSDPRVVETFDRWADEGRDAGMEEGHGEAVRQVVGRLGVRPGEKILELGCGNGWATRLLAQAAPGVQAVGIDASPKMIARAEELSSYKIRARYELGSFEALDFPDASFDRVFSMEALYYARDLDVALREAFRVLKPGGAADVLVDYYEENPASEPWAETMRLRLHRLSEAGWREALERAGFAGVRTERVKDSRPLSEPAECDECLPSQDAHRAHREAGTLWVHGEKP